MGAHRAWLEHCHAAAVAAVGGRQAVARSLTDGSVPAGPLHVVAVGKAAAAMMQGVIDTRPVDIVSALVITREGYDDPTLHEQAPVETYTAPHPVPDERSLAAGEALVEFMQRAPRHAHFLFLLSGGASSLVERLADQSSAVGLAALNEQLLASGWDIGQMNQLRKSISTIKGGRLAGWLKARRADVLLISDVSGDDPSVIGSGLLFADRQPLDRGIAAKLLPDGLALAAPPPAATSGWFKSVYPQIIASNAIALKAAAAAAMTAGWSVECPAFFLDGEAGVLGQRLGQAVCNRSPGITLWGGEPIVHLPAKSGRGGRMQTLALAAAIELADSDCELLAAGTDGADGPGIDAGAIVDGGSIARGRAQGLAAQTSLAAADAGNFLAASKDLFQTGPTGTNVMDIVIGLKPD
ncbi:MAG: DUF4147 domain-containing protein [Spiribacter sp.]|nr:DUF4147 domain-containing protein [Spiribacter sp.]MDR9489001.1 DUF4147 domain-containing protein [Spiribacter sp.]